MDCIIENWAIIQYEVVLNSCQRSVFSCVRVSLTRVQIVTIFFCKLRENASRAPNPLTFIILHYKRLKFSNEKK